MRSSLLFLAILLSISLGRHSGAIAQPKPTQPVLRRIEVKSDTLAFQDQTIRLGNVQVQLSYTPLSPAERLEDRPNFTYKIFNQGKLQLTESLQTTHIGGLYLMDLDNNLNPEVIVKSFSGGSHCCSTLRFYGNVMDQYQQLAILEGLDGLGGDFIDLDGNGSWELVSTDQAFLYSFSGYAQSFPPSKIWAWSQGKLIDVTRRYPKTLRDRATKMFAALQELEQGKSGLSNHGILAGYVAQKILLGEFDSGWKLMLARYDKNSPPQNFPNVLRDFLTRQGYLTPPS